MRKNFQNIGFYPQPVLVIGTYDENGTPDAMNVGWGGLVGSVYVELNISEGHKTTANLRKKGAFTVSFADQAHLVEADYVGLVSGNTTPDKIAKAGLHPLKSEFVDAPLFEEFPLTLECEVAEITDGPGGLRVDLRRDRGRLLRRGRRPLPRGGAVGPAGRSGRRLPGRLTVLLATAPATRLTAGLGAVLGLHAHGSPRSVLA